MVDPVKPSRRYDSPRRREQAAATRRSMLETAQRLFEADGYVATSVPAIAEQAGVALKTVYLAFETKANLLRVLWEERLSGEEADLDVTERAWYREMLDEPDAQRQLRLLASQSRAVKSRSGLLMDVIRNAAGSDPEIAALWKEIQSKLLGVQGSVVERLHEKDCLKGSLDVATATDILWALNHPSLWYLFVVERGWSGQEYERWLGDIFIFEMLGKR
ncbi:MAG: TetR/AcrR family transcriptional regulator [Actinomycetota bacterium]|nr:TetR/AcrR family transcriptional regulator [Actinomycetota bacterium]